MHLSAKQHDVPAFVAECKARLQKILQRLEWSEEEVLRNFNTNSLAATPQLHKKPTELHITEAPTYPDSCISKNCLKLDAPQLQNLLQDNKLEAPTNFLDLQANFSREQKLRIYEHTIQNTKKLDNNTVDEVPEGERSLADIVAEKKREAKHKRRKFRVAKPTRIEEVRAVVELQMQSLQQFIKNQKKEDQRQETRYTDLYRRPIDARRNHDNDRRGTYNMEKSSEKLYRDNRSRGKKEEKSERNETMVYKNSKQESSSKVYRKEYEYRHYKSSKSKHRSRSKSPKLTKRKHRSRSKSPHYAKAKYCRRSRSPKIMKSKHRSRSKSPKNTERKHRSRSISPKSTEYCKRSHQKDNERHRKKSRRSPSCSKSSTHKDDKRQHGRARDYDQYNTDERRENERYNHEISEDREISRSKKDRRSERRDQGQKKVRRYTDHRRSSSRDERHKHKKKHKRSRTRSRSREHRKKEA